MPNLLFSNIFKASRMSWGDSFVGVGIVLTNRNSMQCHVGVVVYKELDDHFYFVHQEGHNRLTVEKIDRINAASKDDYYIAIELLPKESSLAIVIPCIDFFQRIIPNRSPYSFSLPSKVVDEVTNDWLLQDKGPGFSCATFVYYVFNEVISFPLIKYDTWIPRYGQREFIECISEYFREPQRGQIINEASSVIRIMPEDVFLGMNAIGRPIDYQFANDHLSYAHTIVKQ